MKQIYKSEVGAGEIQRRYQQTLAAWPVPADHLRIPTREGETFVVASGPADAPPVVLLHGSGANAGTWIGDIDSWANHFRVYAVDMIGEPGSSARSRPALTSDAMARWLDDVLDGLSVPSASIVGMSLGGWVAVDYAIRRPDRVERLALYCPGGIGPQRLGWLPKALLLRALGRRGARKTARMVTGLDTPQTEPILDDVVLTFEHFNPRTERLPIFPDADLRGLAMPVLAIVGDRDVMMDSATTARRLRACVPHATVTVLPDTGHAVLGQTGAVLDFLRGEAAPPHVRGNP